jgi:hypothetical protein
MTALARARRCDPALIEAAVVECRRDSYHASVGSLALGGLVLLAFRGCPICWTIGLFETARLQWRRRQGFHR